MIELEKLVTCKPIGIKDLNLILLSYDGQGFFYHIIYQIQI